MARDIDEVLERRRLRRRGRFWRFAAILFAVVALVVAIDRTGVSPIRGERIARLTIEGTIVDDPVMIEGIGELAEDVSVAAVILHVDSPGGTVSGAEALYESLRKLAETKPLAVTMGSVAASGGYIAAIAGDHIVARRNSITGSIGVIFQSPDVSGLLDTLGVRVDEIKSAPLKGQPTGLSPMSDEVREAMRGLLQDSFAWFRDLVAERRGLAPEIMAQVTDGRVFTGGQAVGLGLVDAVGGEDAAIAWLEAERGVAPDLPVVPYDPGSIFEQEAGLIGQALAGAARLLGREAGLSVDGLVSVWQPTVR
ncbi:signal peptide peptidase SppA [Futiania mangrovi]|uniref:Signal peptide peptidase SppA n=1 Tax=Futiania mangrovi TaxID=2959716 RepID=A0A9J6PFH3_9PROT|nr:signal peptide peptidase SppA [Futiania mangrovii]MCP1337214.1 signal peptide peptidase SppA [Futiania mangrovii]